MNYDRYIKIEMIDKECEQYIYAFENGYGASVIRSINSYGGKDGLWEVATVIFNSNDYIDFEINYDIWEDVKGYLTFKQVEEYLKEIMEYKG